ncbi:MAG: hypothetical protein ACD_40C00197G0016 [uncultured bacterium]|nr:MAG: hypothetical protein ACD_40C00197G0016 [uncultured bacterium]
MSTRVEAQVNSRAGQLANGTVEALLSAGINKAVVWVADGFASRWPLAVRNTKNDGFWGDTFQDYRDFQHLTSEAKLQADYAMTAPGRSASKQLEKLGVTDRTAASYGIIFNRGVRPGYAVDTQSGLTVVAIADGVDPLKMAEISEKAIEDVENGRMPNMLEAGKWLHACFAMLEKQLDPKFSGIAMIALPRSYSQLSYKGPTVVGVQAVGNQIDPAKYSIVEAKVECVVATRKPSGTLSEKDGRDDHSNILGGVPAIFEKYGERVLGVGGLDMKDDVALISEVASQMSNMGVTILDEFAKL